VPEFNHPTLSKVTVVTTTNKNVNKPSPAKERNQIKNPA